MRKNNLKTTALASAQESTYTINIYLKLLHFCEPSIRKVSRASMIYCCAVVSELIGAGAILVVIPRSDSGGRLARPGILLGSNGCVLARLVVVSESSEGKLGSVGRSRPGMVGRPADVVMGIWEFKMPVSKPGRRAASPLAIVVGVSGLVLRLSELRSSAGMPGMGGSFRFTGRVGEIKSYFGRLTGKIGETH